MSEPELALVLTADAWVGALHRYCADHGGARVRCAVVEPAGAVEEHYDVLVVAARWPALTRPLVADLRERGRRVLAVADDPAAAETVEGLGADAVVASSTPPAGVVAAAVALAARAAHPCAPDTDHADRPGPSRAGGVAAGRRGAVVVVGGPAGAGSTEVALGLATAIARAGRSALVVDADDATPSIAARLGLPLEPNLCTAVDAVAYGLGALPGTVLDLGRGWPAVLVGAPSRRAAAAVRASDVVAVGEVLATRYSPVVLDVSAGAATAPGDSVASAALGSASALVAVGAATPVGIVRVLEWVDALGATPDGVAVHVAVNRVPTSRLRRAAIADELDAARPGTGVHLLPVDPRVEASAWAATVPRRGPFARAVTDLARRVVAPIAHRRAGG